MELGAKQTPPQEILVLLIKKAQELQTAMRAEKIDQRIVSIILTKLEEAELWATKL
mgnify:CR=1 FL=1